MTDLDSFDVRLLNCLQVDAHQTSEVLSRQVGLSATACQRRIKKLRASGAIEKEIAVVSPDVMGDRVTLMVQVTLNRGGVNIIDEFKRDVAKIPEVQQCYYVTGDYDFALIITARSMAEYEQLTRKNFFENLKILRFHTTVVMETVKAGLHIPL